MKAQPILLHGTAYPDSQRVFHELLDERNEVANGFAVKFGACILALQLLADLCQRFQVFLSLQKLFLQKQNVDIVAITSRGPR